MTMVLYDSVVFPKEFCGVREDSDGYDRGSRLAGEREKDGGILLVSCVYEPCGAMGRCEKIATIRLTGRWLEGLGFRIGGSFRVNRAPGRIELVTVGDREESCH